MPAYLITHTKNVRAIWNEILLIIAASLPADKEYICLLIKRLFKNLNKDFVCFKYLHTGVSKDQKYSLPPEKRTSPAWHGDRNDRTAKRCVREMEGFKRKNIKVPPGLSKSIFFLWELELLNNTRFILECLQGVLRVFFFLPLLDSTSCWHQTNSHYTFLVMSMKNLPDIFLHCIAHLDLNREIRSQQKAQELHNYYAISCSIKITVYLQKSI